MRAPRLWEADWRFLLSPFAGPEFGEIALDGGPSGLAAMLVRSGIAERVVSPRELSSASEALVVLAGSALDTRQAYDLIQPGQSLYVERLGLGSVRQVRGGPAVCHSYLILGEPGEARRFIQLHPTAFAWYAGHLVSGSTLRHRILQDVIGRCPGAAAHAARIAGARIATVARKPEAKLERSPDGRRPRIQLSSGVDDGSRIVTLRFEPGCRSPAYVAKTSRHRDFNDRTRSEQQALGLLYAALAPELAATVPRPLGHEQHGSLVTARESWSPGTRMIDLAWRRNRAAGQKIMDLRLATDWLTRAHRRLRSSQTVDASEWLELTLRLPDTVRERWQPRYPDALAVVDSYREDAADLYGVRLATTFRHRDFTPWNVLREGGSVRVIDWENARLDAPPGPGLSDLLYFVLHWSFAVNRLDAPAEQGDCLRQLVTGSTDDNLFQQAARGEIDTYVSAFGVERRLITPLWVAMLAEHAVERERRESLAGATGGDIPPNGFAELLGAVYPVIG